MGFAEFVGNHMTCWVLTKDYEHLLPRLDMRKAGDKDQNHCAELIGGEHEDPHTSSESSEADKQTKTHVKSVDATGEDGEPLSNRHRMPVFDPEEIMGRTFLMEPNEDGPRHAP